ncbi:MAG: hypothetical protein ACKVU1_12115 [bacterium]
MRLLRGATHGDADVLSRDANVGDVDYTDRATLIELSRRTRIRIDRPCFVRVEVYLTPAPLLFSNPIVFY